MKEVKHLIYAAVIVVFISACSSSEKDYDASGSFEAVERTISAEATGKIKTLNINEGQKLKVGDTIGSIDVTTLSIQSEQVQAGINAIRQKTNSATAQIKVIEQQISNVEKEINRFKKLVKANAVPQKQLDDLIDQSLVLKEELQATKDNVNSHNRAILSEIAPNKKHLELIEEQIKDGTIVNEYDGTVTTQIAYDGEFTSIGRPLYKIANLENITLRAYITGNQLPQVKLNQEVTVRTDNGEGDFTETKGVISWISSKAEFTPKTIQTKNERANLVYAIKVLVKNDGTYKIGMYGEITF